MGKQNNNFEYYKPQNGSSLIPSDSESGNSDTQTMFQLPKRKIFRSKGSSFSKSKQRRKCCQICCGSVAPLVISIFILGTLTSIGYILLGVNGMKRELELLKIHMNKVESEEKSNLKDNEILQHKIKEQLKSSTKDKEIKRLNARVTALNSQVKILNATVAKLQAKTESKKDASSSSSSVAKDVTLLKKGMADTGGEIKKLTDDGIEAKKTIKLLTEIVKGMKNKFTNLSRIVAKISRHPLPTESVDTLEPLVATTIPIQSTIEVESMGKVSRLFRKLLNGYSDLFKNKTTHLKLALMKLEVRVAKLNKTHGDVIGKLKENVTELQNAASRDENKIGKLSRQLSAFMVSNSNLTSESKILGVVKDILLGLKKHQALISNLTKRMERIDKNMPTKNTDLSTRPIKPATKMSSYQILTTLTPTTLPVSVAEDRKTVTKPSRSSKVKIKTFQSIITTASSNTSKASSSTQAMVNFEISSSSEGNFSVPNVKNNSMHMVNSTEPAERNNSVNITENAAPTSVMPSRTSATKAGRSMSSMPDASSTIKPHLDSTKTAAGNVAKSKRQQLESALKRLREAQNVPAKKKKTQKQMDDEVMESASSDKDEGQDRIPNDRDEVLESEDDPRWGKARDTTLQNDQALDSLDESA